LPDRRHEFAPIAAMVCVDDCDEDCDEDSRKRASVFGTRL